MKNQTFKKLIGIHQRILQQPKVDEELMFGSKQELLENILINISCIKETRELGYSDSLQKQSNVYEKKVE